MSSLLSLGESFCDDDHPLLEPIAEHLEQVARVRSRVRADRRRRGWTVIVGSEGVRWVLAEVLAEVLAVHGPSTARDANRSACDGTRMCSLANTTGSDIALHERVRLLFLEPP